MERNCVFCAIAAGEAPAEMVYTDEETMAFLDINPAAPGHTLVIPRRHYRNVYDVSTEAGAAVMRSTIRVARAIRDSLQPDGLNLLQSNEGAGFQSVFHLHIHVVPRWFGDKIVLPWRPRPGDSKAMREIGGKIRKAMIFEGGTEIYSE